MELWYSLVIGTVIYFYVIFFNRNAKNYLESQRTQPFTLENMMGVKNVALP
jgi:hypothetical protein